MNSGSVWEPKQRWTFTVPHAAFEPFWEDAIPITSLSSTERPPVVASSDQIPPPDSPELPALGCQTSFLAVEG